MIGRSPRWARLFQPIIQMAASFPGANDFPGGRGRPVGPGGGLGISSVLLLMLGTQCTSCFNVIAGSSVIPRELWAVSRLARFFATAPLADPHFAGHLSKLAHRLDYRYGRCVERQHRR